MLSHFISLPDSILPIKLIPDKKITISTVKSNIEESIELQESIPNSTKDVQLQGKSKDIDKTTKKDKIEHPA